MIDYSISGSSSIVPIAPGLPVNAEFYRIEEDLTREEMGVSVKEYDIQKALGSLPQKIITSTHSPFDSFLLVSGSISQSCQTYPPFIGICS
ncbi:hypothetical protein LCGC14_2030730 [marine sediment metagenome]|uniref:Uncharacterized protein n=1 Tax=marine sediment metagenome TaxID=412755 RepID=A0A0F9H860_9ZZZZ